MSITATMGQGSVRIRLPYNPALTAEVKALPGRRYDPDSRSWTVPTGPELRAWAEARGIEGATTFDRRVQPTVTFRRGGWAELTFGYDAAFKTEVKARGGTWDQSTRRWTVPLTPEVIEWLGIQDPTPTIDAGPLGDSMSTLYEGLYTHQMEAVAAVQRGADRVLLADEPGLGKTISALVAAQSRGAKRIVVVCPAVVRLNWAREVETWLSAPVQVVKGRKPVQLIETGVVVISYDVADAHAVALTLWHPDALLVDEGHCVKNPKSRRTKAVVRVAEATEGLIMVLTGTPVPAEVVDLIGPLSVLGLEGHFGGYWGFAERYAYIERSDFGTKVTGSRNAAELHGRLNRICLIRRTKADALDLPARTVVDLPVEPSKTYTASQSKLIRELVKAVKATAKADRRAADRQMVSAVVASWLYGEGRSATGALVHEAGRSKVAAAVEQVISLHEAGERVVVMAHHQDVQQALRDELAKVGLSIGFITGGQTDAPRQRYIDAFQAGEIDVLVCSIQAAGVGITLTAASHMVMVELPWTDAAQTQAIDRIHRIGQERAVTCWRLVAVGTTDETQAARIARRAEMSANIIDGEDSGLGEVLGLGAEHLIGLVCEALRV